MRKLKLKKLMGGARYLLALLLVFDSMEGLASEWSSFTWDNDIFVASDDGYTNGFYYSWYVVDQDMDLKQEAKYLLSSLRWNLTEDQPLFSVNAYTIGQSMFTPEDIGLENPNPSDIPYSGFLFFNNTYLSVHENYADKLSVTVGVVGPASGAEQTQRFVHDVTNSDYPQGWDYQLKNELVFQFTRGRIWRTWVASNGKGPFDLVLGGEVSLGTIESKASTMVMFRYGEGLSKTYVTPGFHSNRTSNPLAVTDGWFFYAGLMARYIGNQIFVDGNTFRDSRSAELDRSQIGLSLGFSYAWEDSSLSIAVEQMQLFEKSLDGVSHYGTLTYAWRL